MINTLSCNRGEYIFLRVKIRNVLNFFQPFSKYKSIAFDRHGYLIRAGNAETCEIETNDYDPSLFVDIPANRQAITTLHLCKSNIDVIDLIQEDKIVIVFSTMWSDMACDSATSCKRLARGIR